MKNLVGIIKWLTTPVVLLVIGCAVTSHVLANDNSLWINSAAPTKALVTTDVQSPGPYFDDTCQRSDQLVRKYKYIGSKWIDDGTNSINDGCWTETNYGLVGYASGGWYMRKGNVGTVANFDESNGSFVPIPHSDRLARKMNNGTSFYRDLMFYDDTNASFDLRRNGTKEWYYQSATPSASYLKNPATNQNVRVNAVSVSSNGKWMVVEGSASFFRVNVETKEVLAFEAPIYTYGSGSNPTYGLAISNDGRYVVITGGGNNTRLFAMYGLSTCIPVLGQPFSPSSGCGKRDLKPVVLPNAAWDQGPTNVKFSNNSENISFNLAESGKVNNYIITAPSHDQHLLEYLALGDSFSSGEGDSDGGRYYLAGTDGNGEVINDAGLDDFPYWRERCHVSMRSYPYILASNAGLGEAQFRSVACSGARMDDLLKISNASEGGYYGQYGQMFTMRSEEALVKQIKTSALDSLTPGREAQIKFVEKYRPRVATIGIGGNDINFSDKIKGCIAFAQGTCHFATTDRYYTALEIRSLYAKLVDAYNQLKSVSPTTHFYAVGYPQIASTSNMCTPNVRLDQYEREFARETVRYLNQVIRAAANKTGVYYLDIENSLAGYSLCDANSLFSNAVNGLKLGSDVGVAGEQSHYFGMIGNESYHPNNLGHEKMAAAIEADLNSNPINTFSPCLSQAYVCWPDNPLEGNIPAIPNYFSSDIPPGAANANIVESYILGVGQVMVDGATAVIKNVQQGVEISAKNSRLLLPASQVIVKLFSTPLELGTLTVNAEGNVIGQMTIPGSVEPGYHTLHLIGTSLSGVSVDMYQTVFVYSTLEDLDGDGIPNHQDVCGLVEPANADEDVDGVDDACDGFIGEVEQHPLYRVRNGDVTKGELESRFYIERDVLEAKSKLNIVNDYDPDGDGWALVGHTGTDYDGGIQTRFWIDEEKVPHLLLNGEDSTACVQLTPVSLGVVSPNESRVLQVESDDECSQPQAFGISGVEAEDKFSAKQLPIGSVPGRGSSLVQGSITTTFSPWNGAVQHADPLMSSSGYTAAPSHAHVAGVSTNQVPNYFDGPGETSADVTTEVSNTFLIGGSIMLATLLGIIVLARSLAIFSK